MKICFIGDASGYHVGRWVRYFGQTSHEVHCISTQEADLPGVKVHALVNRQAAFGLRHLFYPRYFAQVRRLLRDIRPDVVHGLQINLFSYLALRTGHHPFAITPFGGDVLVNPQHSWLAKHMAETCLRHADLVTTDATHIQETLIRFGASPERIHRIHFATDVDQYRPMPKDEGLVESLGIRGRTCVLSLRHLMPIYDIDTLIRSLPIVREQVPNIVYLIGSRGPEEARLKALADQLGVADSIRWLGFLQGPDLPRYDNLGDIYVSTSLSDAGLASSTGETMACGLPAVVTDFGDNRDWIQDGVNGYLFPLGDHQALAERLVILARDPALRRTMGEANRRIIEERYNWAKEMARMEALYCQAARPGEGA